MLKVIGWAGAVAGAASLGICALPSATGAQSAAELVPWTLAVAVGSVGAIVTVLIKIFTKPVRQVTDAVRILAKGNFKDKVYPGKITRSAVRNASELDRAVLMLELLRRKVIEGKKNLSDSMKQKALDLQRINDELAEQEDVLRKANSQLEAQAEEFRRMNEELSSKNHELSVANARLKDLDRLKDDFISVAAQELCVPLEPILESVDQIELGTGSDEEAWESIISGSRRLVSVANNILDLGRIESGNFEYRMAPMSVRKLLEELAGSIMPPKGNRAELKFEMDPAGDIMVTGDKKRLIQALSSIINNSIAFAANGKVTVTATADHGRHAVIFGVQDDGPAFPADALPALFDKYAVRPGENERGVGLGLFVSRTIIEAHAGAVKAENSSSGRGVLFTVTIPTSIKKEKQVSQVAQA